MESGQRHQIGNARNGDRGLVIVPATYLARQMHRLKQLPYDRNRFDAYSVMAKVRADQDSPWKLILRAYFPEAIAFFFPDVAKIVDWTQPIEFLDSEFQKIAPDAAIGKRYADQLVKLQGKHGKPLILLIHIEIQAAPEKNFPERMFIYAVRIFEYFHQPPISLAILCDGKKDWRPSQYGFATVASSLQFNFTSIKLLDYQAQWQQLEQSQNPFAIVVMAHLKTQETKRNADDRKAWKFTLVRRLYEQGYSRSYVLDLFKFIDWIMILPEALKRSFWEELKTYEEERRMPYITSVEQIGIEKGIEQGIEQGERSMILGQLEHKFGPLPDRIRTQIHQRSPQQLAILGKALLDFVVIGDLEHWLTENS